LPRLLASALVLALGSGVAVTSEASALPFPPLASEDFNPSNTLTGEVSTMTITLSNPNAGEVDGVGFSDSYPPGIVNAPNNGLIVSSCSGTLTASPSGTSLTLAGASIAPGGYCYLQVGVVGVYAGSFDNDTGTISSSNAPPGPAASATLVVANGPVLQAPVATKAFVPATVAPGAVSRMTITLTNPDPWRAITGAQFSDVYPGGMINIDNAMPSALVSDSCGGTATADANAVSSSLIEGVVPAAGSCSVVIDVVGTSQGPWTNQTSTITSTNASTGSAASATLTVMPGELLDAPTVAESFTPDHIIAGDPLGTSVMAITLTNNDPDDITGVSFADDYPTPLHMANASSGVVLANTCGGTLTAVANQTTVALTGGTIPASQSCVVKIQVVGTSQGTSVNHTGSVTSDNANPGADTTATLFVTGGVAEPDMVLTKTHVGDFTQGQTGATYTLVATNVGVAPTSGSVIVVDTLPAALVATDMSGPGWTCDLQTISCTWIGPPLDPGASYPAITLTVDVATMAPPTVTNTATVSGGGETNTSNDSASDPTTIDSAALGPDLTLTKSHVGNFSQGQIGAVYTLIAHNIGGAASS